MSGPLWGGNMEGVFRTALLLCGSYGRELDFWRFTELCVSSVYLNRETIITESQHFHSD